MFQTSRNEEIIDLCKRLISYRSYSGEEKAVACELRRYMEYAGFDQITVDRYGNIIGRIRGTRSGKKLLFDGHMDTVPVQNSGKSHITRLSQR